MIELHFKKASLIKRSFASLIDLFISLLISLLIFFVSLLIFNKSSYYLNNKSNLESIMLDSRLYIKKYDSNNNNDDNNYKLIYFIEEFDESNLIESKDKYLKTLETLKYFYIELNAYSKKEEEGKKTLFNLLEESNLFVVDYQNNLINLKDNILYKDAYNGLKDIYFSNALGLIINNDLYFNSSMNIFILDLILFLISLLISNLIFYFLVPLLVFNKGKYTIGRKIFNLGLLSNEGFSLDNKKFIIYYLFYLFIENILSLFTLFIPKFISLGMIYFSSLHQSFGLYMSNSFLVAVSNDEIYKNRIEYLSKNNNNQ